jgi:hypothetical protein
MKDDSSGALALVGDGSALPVRLHLFCNLCGTQHIDEGEWATRPHRTHQCQACCHEWRPADFPTVGVEGGITLVSSITGRRVAPLTSVDRLRHARVLRFCMCRQCKESVARHFAATHSLSDLILEGERLGHYLASSSLGLQRGWLRHLLETIRLAADLSEEKEHHG